MFEVNFAERGQLSAEMLHGGAGMVEDDCKGLSSICLESWL